MRQGGAIYSLISAEVIFTAVNLHGCHSEKRPAATKNLASFPDNSEILRFAQNDSKRAAGSTDLRPRVSDAPGGGR
jgi:hypothetical protein